MRSARNVVLLTGLFAAYVIAGKLGLQFAFVQANASAVWPPAGIALAAFLICGARVWPVIFAGAFIVNITTAGSTATSLAIAAGNTLEGLIGAHLINRYAGGRAVFERTADLFRAAGLLAAFSTTVSATIGVASLTWAGFAAPADFRTIWATWWLGDITGDLVVAPLVILWSARPLLVWRPSRIIESIGLSLSVILVGLVVFCGLFAVGDPPYPLTFFCLPCLLWAAFRFTPRRTAAEAVVLSGLAVWGTIHGIGPFARSSQNESLVLLQMFTGLMALTSLALAAAVAERRRALDQLQLLAVTDPLTGLADYRRLGEVLALEVRRAQRTGRVFAVLFMDMDRLKSINDQHGHIVGSRALSRVADALRATCRVTDTPARFGGDEFAVVLPDTDGHGASQLGRRVAARIGSDGGIPVISISWGAVEYPRDGTTAEMLLASADGQLYRAKGAAARSRPVTVQVLEGST